MPAEMQTTSKPITLDQLADQAESEWRQQFDDSFGDRPNLNREITLTLGCEGMRVPMSGRTTLYGALFLCFHQSERGNWECGPFECFDNMASGELHIAGGEMHLSIQALKALEEHFGVVNPTVPAYVHRSGPLFDNMALAFKRELRALHRREGCTWQINEEELEERARHRVLLLLIRPAMGSGLDII